MVIFKIFLLLFLPIFFWALYSFLPVTYTLCIFELPKMEKIELLSYSLNVKNESISNLKTICNPVPSYNSDINESASDKNNTNMIKMSVVIANENLESNVSSKSNQNNETAISNSMQSQQKICVDLDNTLESNNSSKVIKILVIGDSMGEGIAYGLSRLKNKYPIKFKSLAKSSTTTFYWNSELLQNKNIELFSPDIVLIALGTNEWNGVGSATKLRIMKIYNKLQAMGLKSIWITPPVTKSTKFYEMVHEVYGELTYDSRMLNVPRGPDKIHPTLNGYISWTNDILTAVNIKRE